MRCQDINFEFLVTILTTTKTDAAQEGCQPDGKTVGREKEISDAIFEHLGPAIPEGK